MYNPKQQQQELEKQKSDQLIQKKSAQETIWDDKKFAFQFSTDITILPINVTLFSKNLYLTPSNALQNICLVGYDLFNNNECDMVMSFYNPKSLSLSYWLKCQTQLWPILANKSMQMQPLSTSTDLFSQVQQPFADKEIYGLDINCVHVNNFQSKYGCFTTFFVSSKTRSRYKYRNEIITTIKESINHSLLHHKIQECRSSAKLRDGVDVGFCTYSVLPPISFAFGMT
ncbi:hypothetical protein RFI_07344 [Reticulomyxa filosa]|uniref:Uncharacterized protein n=1 Tax=Reticulomyxa filosa TaxID=46433 RepID=X6NU04_RETFI|nr:hypothetical protein RFI_07344 [Reticulomyxa filosa]|eukprot:ETO29775.1 hypothetical protein RFI_07344 [Reticulomyxa filosa]